MAYKRTGELNENYEKETTLIMKNIAFVAKLSYNRGES